MFHTLSFPAGIFTALLGGLLTFGIALCITGKMIKRSVRAQVHTSTTLRILAIVCLVMILSFFLHGLGLDGALEGFGPAFTAHPLLPVARALKVACGWMFGWLGWGVLACVCVVLAIGEMPSKAQLKKAGLKLAK